MSNFSIPEEIIGIPLFVTSNYASAFEIDEGDLPNGGHALVIRGDIDPNAKAIQAAPTTSPDIFHFGDDVAAVNDWSMAVWLKVPTLSLSGTNRIMFGCTNINATATFAAAINRNIAFQFGVSGTLGLKVERQAPSNAASPSSLFNIIIDNSTFFTNVVERWCLLTFNVTAGVTGTIYLDRYATGSSDTAGGSAALVPAFNAGMYLHIGPYATAALGRQQAWRMARWAFFDHALTHADRTKLYDAMYGYPGEGLLGVGWTHAYLVEGPEWNTKAYLDANLVGNWPDEVNLVTGDLLSVTTDRPTYAAAVPLLRNASAVAFSAAQFMQTGTLGTISPPYTVVVIGKRVGVGSTTYAMVSGGAAGDSSHSIYSNGGTSWRIYNGTTAIDGGAVDANVHIFENHVGTGATDKLVVDGETVIGPLASSGDDPLVNIVAGGLGITTPSFKLSGHMSFIGVYEGDPTTDPGWDAFVEEAETFYGLNYQEHLLGDTIMSKSPLHYYKLNGTTTTMYDYGQPTKQIGLLVGVVLNSIAGYGPTPATYPDFDGTNDYGAAGGVADQSLTGGKTIFALIKPDTSTGMLIFSRYDSAAFEWGFSCAGGVLQLNTTISNGSLLRAGSCSGVVTGQWNAVAATIMGTPNTTQTIKLCVNGVWPTVSHTTGSGTYVASNGSVVIGGRDFDTASRFDGSIGHVAMFPILADADVDAIMAAAHTEGWF